MLRGILQASSPACTELETIVMDWLGKMIGLPSEFLHSTSNTTSAGGGVIQVTHATNTCSKIINLDLSLFTGRTTINHPALFHTLYTHYWEGNVVIPGPILNMISRIHHTWWLMTVKKISHVFFTQIHHTVNTQKKNRDKRCVKLLPYK